MVRIACTRWKGKSSAHAEATARLQSKLELVLAHSDLPPRPHATTRRLYVLTRCYTAWRLPRAWARRLLRLERREAARLTANAYVSTLGGGYFMCRHNAHARTMARVQERLALSMGDTTLAGRCRVNLAYSELQAGEIAQAQARIEQEIAVATRWDDAELLLYARTARNFAARVAALETELRRTRPLRGERAQLLAQAQCRDDSKNISVELGPRHAPGVPDAGAVTGAGSDCVNEGDNTVEDELYRMRVHSPSSRALATGASSADQTAQPGAVTAQPVGALDAMDHYAVLVADASGGRASTFPHSSKNISKAHAPLGSMSLML